VKYCSDFPGAPICCSACHYDNEEFGMWLCGDDEKYEVCCKVQMWIDEQELDEQS